MERVSNRSYRKGLWLFFILFVVFLILNVFIGTYFPSLALYHEVFDILIPCLIYLLVSKKPIISTLKLDKKLNKKSVVIIFQLFLVSFLLKLGVNYLVMLIGTVDPTRVTMQVIGMAPNLITLFITVAILPAFIEEIFMRGVVLDQFQDTTLWQGAVMTGLLFGLMHVDIGQLGYTTALGIIMGAIVIVTGSLWGSILFHFLNNVLSVALLSALNLVEKLMPTEYEEILRSLSEAETQAPVHMEPASKLYYFIFGVVCLIVGIKLSVHYIKKLQKVNNSQVGVEEGDKVERESDKRKVTWRQLFVNLPFGLILLVYIGVQVIL